MPKSDFEIADTRELWKTLAEIALIFAIFFLHGAWPTPDVNENGYLCKAQHYWNPQAFEHDFFCNTGDAHAVYYWAFGWVMNLGLSLDAAAWVGRVVTWLLLAIAWRGLSYSLIPRPWLAVLSAELFVMLTEQAHMAGEWIVGGIEAKGFAWALVLWAIQALIRGRWNLALVLIGAATSLHVVVGGWAAVLAALVWLALPRDRASLVSILPGVVVAILLSAAGLYFALKLDWGVDSATIAEASRIQVIERLPHHLLPTAFQTGYVPRHLLLWALFVLLCAIRPTDSGGRRFRAFVAAAMGLAGIGFALGWLVSIAPLTAASVLRFYWFRMSDILVPAGAAIVVLQFLRGCFNTVSEKGTVPFCSADSAKLGQSPTVLKQPLIQQRAEQRKFVRWSTIALVLISVFDLWNQALHFPWLPKNWNPVASRSDKFMVSPDWRDACQWAADHTPPGTIFITPRGSNSFKWYSGRDEAATWKDMPQDARSLLDWYRRLDDVYGLHGLRDLSPKYGAQYALIEKSNLLWSDQQQIFSAATPAYENAAYAIYQLTGGTP